jgi:hypothetical protein
VGTGWRLFWGFLFCWLAFLAGWGGFFIGVLGLGRVNPSRQKEQTHKDSQNLFEAMPGVGSKVGAKKWKVDSHSAFSLIAPKAGRESLAWA